MADSLQAQARSFANQVADLLNRTVTDGVRISTVATADRAIMGYGASVKHPDAKPIPIAVSGRAKVFLYLIHTYTLDPEGVWLTMASTTMSLYTSSEMNDHELVVGIDYIRDPVNAYPASHLHVAGERGDLDDIYLGDVRKNRRLRDLHLPTGGRRFRPALEDLIEFMITERMVEPRDGWQDVVDEHRREWHETQLRAAIRREQQLAADQLRANGWVVEPPPA